MKPNSPHLLINVAETVCAHPETDFSMRSSLWNSDPGQVPEQDLVEVVRIRPGDHVDVWDALGRRLTVKVLSYCHSSDLFIGRVLVEKPHLHYTSYIRFGIENVYDIQQGPDFLTNEGER